MILRNMIRGALLLYLTFTGCGESVSDNKELATFNVDDIYRVIGDVELTDDLAINAPHVIFELDSTIRVRENNLSINSDKITFKGNNKIFAFDEEFAECRENGRSSGDIRVKADEIFGEFDVDINGESAGFLGMYFLSDTDGKLYEEDIGLPRSSKNPSHAYYHKCNEVGHYPGIHIGSIEKDYLTPKSGGQGGLLYINYKRIENFPNMIPKESLGSFRARIESNRGSTSYVQIVEKGPNGQPMKVIYEETE